MEIGGDDDGSQPVKAVERLLDNLGMHDPAARAWAMYDWANSAFATTIIAAVLPVYYAQVAAADLQEGLGFSYWSYTNSAALLIVALISPLLGAVADAAGARKRLLLAFAGLGAAATAVLFFVEHGDWCLASLAYTVGFIGFAAANVFYDSLLPDVARKGESDRLSAAGYALGYLGGGLLLLANLAWILRPGWFGLPEGSLPTRLAFVSVAAWWLGFSLPLARRVREPAAAGGLQAAVSLAAAFRAAGARLATIARDLPRYRELALFLIAFWLYADGIGTIIKLATIYGNEIGIGQGHLIGALVLTQFVGVPFTVAFGFLAGQIGQKRALLLGLAIYGAISCGAYFLNTPWQFWLLAIAVATVQGGTQAISRSLFSSLVPRHRSSEFFGFFSVMGKLAGIFGPFAVGAINQLTGNSRLAILSLLVFFGGGALALTRVDLEAGRARARSAEREAGSRAAPGEQPSHGQSASQPRD